MKKIRILLFTLIVMALDVSGQTRQYHGPELYGLQGPVRKVTTKKAPSIARSNKVEFTNDGRIVDSWLTFDSEGYPIGKDMNMMSLKEIIDISYDAPGQPSAIFMKRSKALGQNADVKFEYAGDDLVGMLVEFPNKKNTEKYSFSEWDKDSHGNWISRKVVKTTTSNGSSKKSDKTEEYTETREIEYF